MLLVGALAGLLSGLLGIGGGVVLVVGMTSLLRYSQHRAHATSLAAIVPTAAVGTVGFLVADAVALLAAAILAAGGLAGAVVGARLMRRVPEAPLRRLFGVFMLAVGLRLLL